MIRIISLSISFLVLFQFFASAQRVETAVSYTHSISGADKKFIVYDPKRKLKIEDFEGQPNAGTDAVAITASGFLFKAGYRNHNGKATLQIQVDCSFDKSNSWMKERGRTPYVLAHEQHHFDIAYISALMFMKRVREATFYADRYSQQLQAIYQQTVKDMEEMQEKYDGETNNGRIQDKQLSWEKRISNELTALL